MSAPALHVHTRCGALVRDLHCRFDGERFRVQEGDAEPRDVPVEAFLDHCVHDLSDAEATAEADLAVVMAYDGEWSPLLVACRRDGKWQDLSVPGAVQSVAWLDLRTQLCSIVVSLMEAGEHVVTRGEPAEAGV